MRLVESSIYFKGNCELRKNISLRIREDETVSKELRKFFSTFFCAPISYVIIVDESIVGVIFGEHAEENNPYYDYNEVIETSYYIFPEYRGNNYIVEAIRIYEDYVKIEGVKFLEFCVSKYNKPSLKTMEKIGAKREFFNFFKKIE